MAQQPAAPTLKATPKPEEVRIDFDVPKDGEPTHAVVRLHEAGGATRMYDAASEKVLPAGEKGRAVTLKEPEESETPARKSLIATGLEGGTFEATVAFRRADDVAWGPMSPRSAPLATRRPHAPFEPPPLLCRAGQRRRRDQGGHQAADGAVEGTLRGGEAAV